MSAGSVYAQAKNAILFIGDGVGVSSLNAASIYNYGKAQALYIQSMPHVALSDTSTTREWVPDGPAAATAWATGVKVHNKIMSETDVTERSATDGQHLKTIIEYAEERGLSTGLITNLAPAGIADPVISASYAHLNKPPRRFSGETFLQLLNIKYGDGPDVVIGTGRQLITSQVNHSGQDLAAEIRKHGYVYLDSVAAVSKLNPASSRIIALADDPEFDLNDAIQLAVSHLSGNPKGFLLVVLADCHMPDVTKNMEEIGTYDKAIRNIAEARKQDTLLMFAGNFSFDLHVRRRKSAGDVEICGQQGDRRRGLYGRRTYRRRSSSYGHWSGFRTDQGVYSQYGNPQYHHGWTWIAALDLTVPRASASICSHFQISILHRREHMVPAGGIAISSTD
jgi:alkaline phosphatase